jgi:anion-transporting  ArsA/GET3 family ATPase
LAFASGRQGEFAKKIIVGWPSACLPAIVLWMAEIFSSLADKRFLVVTGKGGAGKSLLSLALSHRLSTLGKRVWLVEMGRKRDTEFTRLPSLVGKKKLGHEPTEVTLPESRERIRVSVLDPTQSLAEYVDLKLPTGGLASVLLNNRVTSSFLEVVPGLPDLVALGKLWYSLTLDKSANAPDVVVLDAPATGHAVALLEAPRNFKTITKIGPIYRDAAEMTDFLADPARTGIVLVTLPEEMSVQETLELQGMLAKKFPKPQLFVNKCFPELPRLEGENPHSVVWKAYSYASRRSQRERDALEPLRKMPSQLLPFFFPEPGLPPLYLRISEELA